ncbi:hypothetical protein [Corynebacterium durum]|uniref:hypothetical protein n=1 Tax=Corynebacterium durum TaxID=61592 RepID=UPI004028B837
MKALHFGAGNIGRGFVGVILHNAGYELVFADVAAPLIDALNSNDSYTVHEVGQDPKDITITGFFRRELGRGQGRTARPHCQR